MDRRIIHLDMDAFYASVEQRDRPDLRGLPVAVGGRSRRAVVAAASYEARKFGVRSAMPMFRARRLCPDLAVVDLRMEHHRAVSQQIRGILTRHAHVIEPLARDEFYLDVSGIAASMAEAGALAQRMKDDVRLETELTASAGVGPSKFVAKIASDLRKPDGLVIVEPEAVNGFLAPLPASRMWGVGTVTERRLTAIGIRTLADLAAADPVRLGDLFGKHGPRMVELARGVDARAVQVSRQAKSVSNETTFDYDTTDLGVLGDQIARLAGRVSERLARRGVEGRTVILKLTYRNFQHATRRTTLRRATSDAGIIAAEARALLGRSAAGSRPVRLVGVGVTGLLSRSGGAPLGLVAPDAREGEPRERPALYVREASEP
jgi:DNA polymerase-4